MRILLTNTEVNLLIFLAWVSIINYHIQILVIPTVNCFTQIETDTDTKYKYLWFRIKFDLKKSCSKKIIYKLCFSRIYKQFYFFLMSSLGKLSVLVLPYNDSISWKAQINHLLQLNQDNMGACLFISLFLKQVYNSE